MPRRFREPVAFSNPFRLALGLGLLVPRTPVLRSEAPSRAEILGLEDRRFFSMGSRLAGALPRSASRTVIAPAPAKSALPSSVAFAVPKRVSVCVRRKSRREVILAKGKGGGAHRRPRRNWLSDINC